MRQVILSLGGADQIAHRGTKSGPRREIVLTAYLVVEGSITDEAKWAEYRKAVVPLIAQHGGKHLTGAGQPQLLEGTHHGWIIAIFAFPSVQAIHRFWRSPDYVPVKEIRRGAADLDIWIVPGSA